MELSEEQKRVVDRAIDNIFRHKKASFITGGAGVGKTLISNTISDLLYKNGMNVFFAAPTHTASNRLQKVLSDDEKNTIEVSTVHKFLGYKLINTVYGKQVYELTDDSRKSLGKDDIVIIDEASMLSKEIYEQLVKVCRHRIIFLGDSCQIPPVAENDTDKTRLMTIDDSEPPVKKCESIFELTKVFRQDKSALLDLCNYVRRHILEDKAEWLYDNKEVLINKIYDYAGVGDESVYVDIPGSYVVQSLINIEDTCFLAYGNPTIEAVQSHLPNWYVDGGYGISNSPVYQSNGGKSSMAFPNNSHIKIKTIKKNQHEQWGVMFDEVETINGLIFLHPSIPDKFNEAYNEWIDVAKYNAGLGIKLTDMQKRNFQKYKYAGLSNKSLNEFTSSTTTLREGRVSTVHRSQGQEWTNCIIALNNILFAGVNMDKEKRNIDKYRKIIAIKLLYTAISRAKSKVVFCFENSKEAYKPG